jgi:hypothetical protein
MKYFPITTIHFEKQFSKLTKKNAVFKGQAAKKIKGIVLTTDEFAHFMKAIGLRGQ